jgi:hypothetical protein
MEIGAAHNSYQSLAMHGGKAGEVKPPVAHKSQIDNVPVKVPAVDRVELRATEQQRQEAIRKAVRSAFKDVYAVSDESFAIFKDASGQYVTRLKSLRDGSITYIPEPNLLRDIEEIGFDTSLLKVNI